MITIFNRKELLLTMDFNRQADVRGILSANQIPYVTKTKNLQDVRAVGGHTGRTLGINQNYSYEYKIYVHKNDYDKAVYLIR